GQEQISRETKFCSRCGFLMTGVADVMANGGLLPQIALNKDTKLSTRKNGLKFGLVWLLVWIFLLTPILIIIGGRREAVAISALIGFVGGIIMMLFSFIFWEGESEKNQTENILLNPGTKPQFFTEKQSQYALPLSQSQPVSSYVPPVVEKWKAPDTGDLVSRSVTENTTKLLSKDE
ncbi:MAG: hypothetical protein M3Q99_02850, partial [Acidobacteriota bacterium]|nr:hypothetical protein [Acidobacteriota bacterium]